MSARAGWQACVLLSLALHLLALPLFNDSPVTGGSATAVGQQRVAHVRLLGVAERRPAAAPDDTPRMTEPAPVAEPEMVMSQPVAPEATREPADMPSPPVAAGGAGLREAAAGGYLPRSALTRAPQAIGVVMLPYPSFDGDEGHYAAQLSLFIDEAGFVQRLEFPARALPPALELVVRQTFMGTRFRPGERDGQPVRSRIEIEVSFDSGLPKS